MIKVETLRFKKRKTQGSVWCVSVCECSILIILHIAQTGDQSADHDGASYKSARHLLDGYETVRDASAGGEAILRV